MSPGGPSLWWRRTWLFLPLVLFAAFDVVVTLHHFPHD